MRLPSLRRAVEALWYGPGLAGVPLAPLGWVYGGFMALRRAAYERDWLRVHRLPVPVVVVGNLTVGGTGKTPVVAWLVARARALGFNPGVVSRGYGGHVGAGPHRVVAGDDPDYVGDEPLLNHRLTGAPVCVGADRPAAARALVAAGCDLIVADDGLQHLALGRAAEVVVIDGERLAGNGRMLPAGPLREPWSRLGAADLVLVNGPPAVPELVWPGRAPRHAFRLRAELAVGFAGSPVRALGDFAGQRVRALAGIGNPQRFYRLLVAAGMAVEPVPVDDHGRARATDLVRVGLPLLMTSKDAVKYAAADRPAGGDWWVVPVEVAADPAAVAAVDRLLTRLRPGSTSP